jgi:hypothetical protein
MPSNGPAENILYGLKGIPLFTYGMIGITTLVLAYITFTDVDIENPLDTVNPVSELQDPTAVVNPYTTDTTDNQDTTDTTDTTDNLYNQEKPVAETPPMVEPEPEPVPVPLPEEPSQEKKDEPKQGGKKRRTIRNKEKKRRTIHKYN